MTRRLIHTALCVALLAVSFAAAGCQNSPSTRHGNPMRTVSSSSTAASPAPASSTPASGSIPSSAAAWQSALDGATLRLGSGGPMIAIMTPKNMQETLAKVSAWLQAGRPYTGDVPQSTFKGEFMANIGPASLSVYTAQKQTITLQPEWYITPSGKLNSTYEIHNVANVLRVQTGSQTAYLTCKPLYDWLKDDQWKAEFEPWRG